MASTHKKNKKNEEEQKERIFPEPRVLIIIITTVSFSVWKYVCMSYQTSQPRVLQAQRECDYCKSENGSNMACIRFVREAWTKEMLDKCGPIYASYNTFLQMRRYLIMKYKGVNVWNVTKYSNCLIFASQNSTFSRFYVLTLY